MKISSLLEIIRKSLAEDYYELRHISSDGLLFVLNDTILPHVFNIKN